MMSRSLGTVEATLPPGFRFHPRDDELICDYLMKKIIDASNKYFSSSSSSSSSSLLIEVDLNKCEPWDIPDIACVGGKEFYFYSQRDRKYATGLRTNRATVSGYWKATGKDRPVVRKGQLVGMRKTLVFYQGRAPKGRKSNWVMHEFRLEVPIGPPKLSSGSSSSSSSCCSKDDWVLCRMFHKSRSELISTKPECGGSHSHNGTAAVNSSTLPALMDSYVSVDQLSTPHHRRPNNITNESRCSRQLDVDVNEDDDYDEDPVEDSCCHDDNVNNNIIGYNNNNNNEQVPCFSIFSPNETKYPTVLFSMDPSDDNNINIITNNTSVNNCAVFGSTATALTQDGPVLLSSNPNNNIINNINNDYNTGGRGRGRGRGRGLGGDINHDHLSECDKHVIKAVLSQLTRMDRPEENISDRQQINMMKVAAGLSPVSLGEAAASCSDHSSYLSDVGLPTPNTMWTNHY